MEGRRPGGKKEWISEEAWGLIEQRLEGSLEDERREAVASLEDRRVTVIGSPRDWRAEAQGW